MTPLALQEHVRAKWVPRRDRALTRLEQLKRELAEHQSKAVRLGLELPKWLAAMAAAHERRDSQAIDALTLTHRAMIAERESLLRRGATLRASCSEAAVELRGVAAGVRAELLMAMGACARAGRLLTTTNTNAAGVRN